jgi:hypothetical protein
MSCGIFSAETWLAALTPPQIGLYIAILSHRALQRCYKSGQNGKFFQNSSKKFEIFGHDTIWCPLPVKTARQPLAIFKILPRRHLVIDNFFTP